RSLGDYFDYWGQ
nr:immunoglobulin heavy chain junction region [Mus musculus]